MKKSRIRQKIQRLMGKCHLGLVHSVEINQLLDHLDYLEVNDVDLKPLPSRQMCRRTFTVHAGTSASNPLLFMEVREDGLITRSANGVILGKSNSSLKNLPLDSYCLKISRFCVLSNLSGTLYKRYPWTH